ncbi:hypothetical protein ACJ73_02823 [Blastomyces percursus]|uniref:Uncharacterized protein n=1 Tax=Blastomyces percursus TaxID=1658174 RepID=A0A1J9QAE6_9EURO|nr:hypothetical protein ACJ73_02823 [Blastomyces percursus]
MTDEQVISRERDTLRLLEQLGTAGAAELLDKVKASEPNPPSFVFRSHNGWGSRTNARFDQELPAQMPLATRLNNNLPWLVASLSESPVDTINPALLSIPEGVWDATVPGNPPQSNPPANSIATMLRRPCGEQAAQNGDTDFLQLHWKFLQMKIYNPWAVTDSSAEEKFCHIFRYATTVVSRSSDQKLRLRICHAILYLSFESLTQEKRSGIHSRRLENHDQHRAATLSVDYLLRRSYPDKWDLMDDQMKQALRRQIL